jgi:hypothetical protein
MHYHSYITIVGTAETRLVDIWYVDATRHAAEQRLSDELKMILTPEQIARLHNHDRLTETPYSGRYLETGILSCNALSCVQIKPDNNAVRGD